MAVTKFLARDLSIAINTGTEGSPTWTAIGGLNSITFAPSKTDADTTDFDSNGRQEHLVAARGMQITLAGFTEEDVSDGSRDPGQEAVETLADAISTDSIDQFRVTRPGGGTWTFWASADVTPMGGGNNDPSAWSAALTVSGTITKA